MLNCRFDIFEENFNSNLKFNFLNKFNKFRNILNNQGIEVIVNLMKDEKETTKAYACICLTNLASDEIIRQDVAQFSFAQSIIPALNSQYRFSHIKNMTIIC